MSHLSKDIPDIEVILCIFTMQKRSSIYHAPNMIHTGIDICLFLCVMYVIFHNKFVEHSCAQPENKTSC